MTHPSHDLHTRRDTYAAPPFNDGHTPHRLGSSGMRPGQPHRSGRPTLAHAATEAF